MERHLKAFPILRLDGLDDFVLAADLYRTARQAGVTIRKTLDWAPFYAIAEQKDLPSQLAVQTKKQWLQEAAGRRLNAAEFRQKFSVTSY